MVVASIQCYYDTATFMAVKTLEPTRVEPFTGLHANGRLLPFPANIRLGCSEW
jgi:hypothetical protein